MRELSGRDLVHANRSPAPACNSGPTTSATSGRISSASSPSESLQSSLVSRLQAQLPCSGSMEYSLTWKARVTPAGRRICALRARARTPKGGLCVEVRLLGSGSLSGHPILDSGFTGWPTPTAGKADGSQMAKGASATGRRPDGSKATVSLNAVAQLAGWATPTAQDHSRGSLPPRPTDTGVPLSQMAALAGWATPSSRDYKSNEASEHFHQSRALQARGKPLSEQAHQLTIGPTSTPFPAETEKRGALNAALSRWLQGYPVEWCQAAIRASRTLRPQRRGALCGSAATAMQSIRRSPRNSSKPVSRP